MGVDCNLYLPESVRLDHVAKVMAIAAGCEKRWEEKRRWIEVAGYKVRCHDSVPSMVTIHLTEVRLMTAYYHFEPEGGGRLLSGRSRPEFIAVAEKVAECFGGFLVYQDCDDKGQYFRPYSNSNASNGTEWMALQERIDAVTPINNKDMERIRASAAYDPVSA